MDTAELGLDDDARDVDLMDEAPPSWDVPALATPQGTVLPARMPNGTLPPPVNDLDGLRSLARRHRLAEAWTDLAHTLRQIIDLGQIQDSLDEEETIDVYAQLGQIEGDVLGNPGEAIDAWREVLRIDPSDVRALTALEDLYVREDRWEDAVDVIEKRAMFVDDEAERRETLLQAAKIWEDQLGELTRAAEIYERLWRADSTDPVASERLESIYRHQGKWTELVDMLLERSEAVAETEPKIETLHEVAEIYEQELSDQESAFYVLQAAFNHDGAHLRTTRELERLATALSRWQDVLEDYGKRATELEEQDRSAAAERIATSCRAPTTRYMPCSKRSGSSRATAARSPRSPSSSGRAGTGTSSARRCSARRSSRPRPRRRPRCISSSPRRSRSRPKISVARSARTTRRSPTIRRRTRRSTGSSGCTG
jgi:tetratricopeptide (TPR) repeat protein